MNCSEARTILFPAPEQALVTIETPRAMDHLQGCVDCRTYFERQRDAATGLRTCVADELAPEAVRQRVASLIEQRRPPAIYRRRHWLVATAAAVMAICLGAVWLLTTPSQDLFREMCADHAKYLDARAQLASGDPAAIEAWFRDKAEFRVRVPELSRSDLLGSRLCFLKRHKAALIFYRNSGRPVSLFQLSSSGVNMWSLDRTVIDGSPLWHKAYDGYSLVAFEDRGVVTVLVSDLSEGDLLPLALAARRG